MVNYCFAPSVAKVAHIYELVTRYARQVALTKNTEPLLGNINCVTCDDSYQRY